jgi:hypothetical protein
MVPSNIAAAMATVSERVGWGWTVNEMSSALQPMSIARTSSEMRSPALGPAIPVPITRRLALSNKTLDNASSRPVIRALPLAAQGNTAFP